MLMNLLDMESVDDVYLVIVNGSNNETKISEQSFHENMILDSEFVEVDIKTEQNIDEGNYSEIARIQKSEIKRNPKQKSRLPSNKIACQICGKLFSDFYVDKHISSHNELCKYFCAICPAAYKTKRALNAHSNTHQGIRPYRCDQCPNAYTSSTALDAHKSVHQPPQFSCPLCLQSFTRKCYLINHIQTHSEERRCKSCAKIFSTSAALSQHRKEAHGHEKKSLMCGFCDKAYVKFSSLKYHLRKYHSYCVISKKLYYNQLPKMVEPLLADDINLFD